MNLSGVPTGIEDFTAELQFGGVTPVIRHGNFKGSGEVDPKEVVTRSR